MASEVIKKMTMSKQVIAAFQTPVAEHKRLATVMSEPEGTEEARSLLAKKRSYFVRMVSDPKIYNPKVSQYRKEVVPSGQTIYLLQPEDRRQRRGGH